MNIKTYVKGMGSALGSKVITNESLENKLGEKARKAIKSTGIKRRFEAGENENFYTLAADSATMAMKNAGVKKEDISGFFVSSNPSTPLLMPSPDSVIADMMGFERLERSGNYMGCAGGVVALQAATDRLSNSDVEKNYLIISGDTTRNMLKEGSMDNILFSDATTAMVVSNNSENAIYGVEDVQNVLLPKGYMALNVPNEYAGSETVKLNHEGRSVFKFATGVVPVELEKMVGEKALSGEYFIIPHQSNERILKKSFRKAGEDNVYTRGIVNVGNTSQDSALRGLIDTYENNLNKDKDILLAVYGEGLNIATAKLKPLNKVPFDASLTQGELFDTSMWKQVYEK